MKATGIVRKLDGLRRLTLPIELCRILGIGDGSPMEIYTEADGAIVIKPYIPTEGACPCCGSLLHQ